MTVSRIIMDRLALLFESHTQDAEDWLHDVCGTKADRVRAGAHIDFSPAEQARIAGALFLDPRLLACVATDTSAEVTLHAVRMALAHLPSPSDCPRCRHLQQRADRMGRGHESDVVTLAMEALEHLYVPPKESDGHGDADSGEVARLDEMMDIMLSLDEARQVRTLEYARIERNDTSTDERETIAGTLIHLRLSVLSKAGAALFDALCDVPEGLVEAEWCAFAVEDTHDHSHVQQHFLGPLTTVLATWGIHSVSAVVESSVNAAGERTWRFTPPARWAARMARRSAQIGN